MENDVTPETRKRTIEMTVTEETKEQNPVSDKKRPAKAPNKPVHFANDSLLSTSSGFHNYRGILNLCIVLLALSNGRVALENIIKYGILIDPFTSIRILMKETFHWPPLALICGSNIFILISFFLERLVSKNSLKEGTLMILIICNLTFVLLFPASIVSFREIHPIGASFTLLVYSIIFLKLVSFSMVNKWCRNDADLVKDKNDKSVIMYPANLTLKDLYYFMFAPTLCYELNFPRTSRIRLRFLLKRAIEILFLSQLILGLIQQWMVPTICNSMTTFKEMNYSKFLERLLKLAVPNHFIWLISFYFIFHSSMNFVGELLKFADRQFYRDWWNSETVEYFWQNWNIPVHRWCLRHVYVPLIVKGYSKREATAVVFFISAFFHEYLVSIPLKMFRVWAFMGMATQMPFAWFVRTFLTGKYSNMAVWLSLIIGQPFAILMYYHDYYIINYEG